MAFDLLQQWALAGSQAERDSLFQRLKEEGKFPDATWTNDSWDVDTNAYPDIGAIDSLEDRQRFTQGLFKKLEFAESRQDSIQEQIKKGVNPCDPDAEFELTPVQRFVGRFLSPQCPYQSALLYHGVGVGKTCAAITIAENFLETYPRRSVFIVAPRNIQPGFRRTIFDDEVFQVSESGPNVGKGCTGNTYLRRTGTEYERDRDLVLRRVNESIKSRYTVLGYYQFFKYISNILSKVSDAIEEPRRTQERKKALRKEFSGRLVIIDEAHNLRDTPGETEDDNIDAGGGDTEMSETMAGKKLTPKLLEVLRAATGMKLVLLTGTPMYNNYNEIIFLFKLLLENDKRGTLSERDIFRPDGSFTEGGKQKLGLVASAYVSFMRGENPLSFPARLPPLNRPTLEAWPERSPLGESIDKDDRTRMLNLPFIPVEFSGATAELYTNLTEQVISRKTGGGISIGSIDEMVQSGNWLFPTPAGEAPRIRDRGFDLTFSSSGDGASFQYKIETEPTTWLTRGRLSEVSPKADFILKNIQTAKGIIFVYSRFIKSGALPFALALEANGYLPWKRTTGLLKGGPVDGLGGQCALCSKRQAEHVPHESEPKGFVQARYVLLTGSATLSPNNPSAIKAARGLENVSGKEIKVVVGSQVASEGIDLKFIREIYMMDSWFHLNKMEQVLGRGVRYCSHTQLKDDAAGRKQTNCTIHLLVNKLVGAEEESADMYMYRLAVKKARQIGEVSRVLKQWALDCNLNRNAIVISGLDDEHHVDSQGQDRPTVDVNDTSFTNLCDWLDDCDYQCAIKVDIPTDISGADIRTYDEYAARWHEVKLKTLIKDIFEKGGQPVFRYEQFQNLFKNVVPRATLAGLLSSILGNKTFRIKVDGKEGYILEKNGLILFQPFLLRDTRIPLALRIAQVPVRQDVFEPTKVAIAKAAEAVKPVVEQAPKVEGEEAPVDTGEKGAYWTTLKELATAMDQTSVDVYKTKLQAAVEAASERYEGERLDVETYRLYMISWFYLDLLDTKKGYTEAESRTYRAGFKQVLLEFFWDHSFLPNDQLAIVNAGKDPLLEIAAAEQIRKRGDREVYRFVDPSTGKLKYMCKTGVCDPSVANVFETDASDPVNSLVCDITKTSVIYGFLVPKIKEARLVFKTSNPPAIGGKLEKGGECSIVSNIALDKSLLVGSWPQQKEGEKTISQLLVARGYKRMILEKDIIYETDRRKIKKKYDELPRQIEKARKEGKADELAKKESEFASVRAVYEADNIAASVFATKSSEYVFENVHRACAIIEIILRWLDVMEKGKEGSKRYFYRPVSALKAKHLATAK
jgi:hypothetical protein